MRRAGASPPRKKPLRILGIDPGTYRTGCGWLEVVPGWGQVGWEVLRAEGEVPDRLLAVSRALEKLLRKVKPDLVALEEAFYGKDVRSLLRIGEARGMILAAVRRLDLPVRQFPPALVKRAVTGNGAAAKTQVASMVARMLGKRAAGAPEDAADALAVAICSAHRVRLEERFGLAEKTGLRRGL